MSSSLSVNKSSSIPINNVERKEIGCFSLNDKAELVNDKSSLNYLYNYRPFRRLDLKLGFDTYIDKDKILPGNLNDILEWYTKGRKEKPDNPGIEFICRRGLLKEIMNSPYVDNSPWAFVVKKFKGVYYLTELLTDQERTRTRSSFEKETCYWGFKFEQYLTSKEMGGKPDTEEPVNNHKQFILVYKNRIGRHSFITSGEVDCLSEDGKEFVELKTRKAGGNEYSLKKFKYRDWWGQNYLVGVKKIVVGLRDDNGFVNELQSLSLDQLCSSAINWRPEVCLGFLDKVLQLVKDVLGKDGGGEWNETYLFEREKGGDVEWRLLDLGELEGGWKGRKHASTKMLQFNKEPIINVIPAWYAQMLEDDVDLDLAGMKI